jgi:hypothetical protein
MLDGRRGQELVPALLQMPEVLHVQMMSKRFGPRKSKGRRVAMKEGHKSRVRKRLTTPLREFEARMMKRLLERSTNIEPKEPAK